jgi:hypothetical protein
MDYPPAVGFHLAFDMMTLGIASFLAARFTRGAISLVTQKVADLRGRRVSSNYGSTDAFEACAMADVGSIACGLEPASDRGWLCRGESAGSIIARDCACRRAKLLAMAPDAQRSAFR